MKLLIIDLFCGAGGTSTGFHLADIGGEKIAKVIACVNHDHMAIESHKANHPETLHFEEKIQNIHMEELHAIVTGARLQYPDALLVLWASLECTNFSKAKGGKPRDADSRSLADYMPWYVEALRPDYVKIENVVEFMSWGPLDANGKPESKRSGIDYLKWVDKMQSLNDGYAFDWRELNSANYGAYTSRNRYFAIFAHNGLPIVWPENTHAKEPKPGNMFSKPVQKWRAVREVLDLEDKGESIFSRKKPLSEKTMARIYAGLIKFVAGGKDAWFVKYNSARSNTQLNKGNTIESPAPVISTQVRLGLCQPDFLLKHFSGNPEGKNSSIHSPAGALTTIDHHAIVNTEFLALNYSNGGEHNDTNGPAGTISTKDRFSLVQPQWLDKNYSGQHNHESINNPSGVVLSKDKHALVSAEPFVMNTNFNREGSSLDNPCPTLLASRRHYYLVNPQWFNQSGSSINDPAFTLIARMDKAPPYLVCVEDGQLGIEVYESDSEYTRKIKEFMSIYGIWDIKMRMLKVSELLKIQGFPEGYVLKGTQTQQKKFIGNSVVPVVVKAMAEALVSRLNQLEEIAA